MPIRRTKSASCYLSWFTSIQDLRQSPVSGALHRNARRGVKIVGRIIKRFQSSNWHHFKNPKTAGAAMSAISLMIISTSLE